MATGEAWPQPSPHAPQPSPQPSPHAPQPSLHAPHLGQSGVDPLHLQLSLGHLSPSAIERGATPWWGSPGPLAPLPAPALLVPLPGPVQPPPTAGCDWPRAARIGSASGAQSHWARGAGVGRHCGGCHRAGARPWDHGGRRGRGGLVHTFFLGRLIPPPCSVYGWDAGEPRSPSRSTFWARFAVAWA